MQRMQVAEENVIAHMHFSERKYLSNQFELEKKQNL